MATVLIPLALEVSHRAARLFAAVSSGMALTGQRARSWVS
jgi:hypothetical protein